MTQYQKVNESMGPLVRADMIVVLLAIVMGLGFVSFFSTGSAPFVEKADIDISVWSLPKYAMLSLTRSFIALVFSFIFAVFYGTVSARSKSFEKILVPLLDVFQSLPVVAFLPGFVLALISVFHNSRWGLEIACLLTIFTGQVWNLAFAYYESQRVMQPEFKEVAKIYQLSAVQKFFFVDLPNGYRPLIYNGMMSMAGGWFFLTTCEAFTIGNHDFRLPGLGSYLSVAFERSSYFHFSVALFVLICVIVGTDLFLWRPLIAWVTRFRDGDEVAKSEEESFFLNLIRDTNIPFYLSRLLKRAIIFLFPKADILEEGATRRILIDNMERWSLVLTSNRFVSSGRWSHLKQSSWLTMVFTFAVGGLVFSLLPKIPDLAKSMSSLKSQDCFDLTHAVFLTGTKVFLSLFLSTLWALPLGLWMGLNPRLQRYLQPVIQNLAAFPAPVIFPLIALCLVHLHLPSFLNSTLLMCIGCQWYILFNVVGGASRIPSDLKLVARIYQFSLWDRFTKLYFPAILPALSTGWITAAGGAWNASMVAEIVPFPGGTLSSYGIGSEFASASAEGNYPRLVAAIIILVIALIVLNRTIWRTVHIYAERVKD